MNGLTNGISGIESATRNRTCFRGCVQRYLFIRNGPIRAALTVPTHENRELYKFDLVQLFIVIYLAMAEDRLGLVGLLEVLDLLLSELDLNSSCIDTANQLSTKGSV